MKPDTPLPWGIEDTGDHLWVGPLRRDGSGKVADIVFGVDILGHTLASKLAHRKDVRFIVAACNVMGADK